MKKITLILGVFVFFACNSTQQTTTEVEVIKETEYISMSGQQIYEAKCGKCHKLPERTNYSADKWSKYVASMVPKTKIKDPQAVAKLTDYLLK